jgi:hypothetical protein
VYGRPIDKDQRRILSASGIRGLLTYSNVVATISIFIALGGTAVAFQLGRNSVKSKNIAPKAVRASDIANGAVGAQQIASAAVGTAQLGPGSVGLAQLGPGSVGSAQLANGAVGATKLAAGSVGPGAIADGAVGATKLDQSLRLRCPATPPATLYFAGVCIETAVRDFAVWPTGFADCQDEGRRLPTAAELLLFRNEPGVSLANSEGTVGADFENTGDVYELDGNGTSLTRVLTAVSDGGSQIDTRVEFNLSTYRCVAAPLR